MSQSRDSPPSSQHETRSECRSRTSRSSHRSITSQTAAKARADAEAARTRAQYAKRQIDMEVEKARIEATLNALKVEGEAEAALAAAQVLEAAADEAAHSAVDLADISIPVKTPPSMRRAQDFVNTHFNDDQGLLEEGEKNETRPVSHQNDTHKRYKDTGQPRYPEYHTRAGTSSQRRPLPTPQTELSELSAYLARRDLLTAGITVFDSRPESYLSWKSMFHNATQGLNFKASEELDLLTKWLGGESLQHALRIRAVHVNNPEAGLQRLWQRLDKSYGSPEVIETSLFQRLEFFPKISHKDIHLLQQLADLLLELEYAQKESYLPGLSFLDTPRGINPIVEKLPYSLQESWVKQGTKYKRDHGAFYPPFSYFVQFVNDHAEMKTDPSFMLHSSNTVAPYVDKTLFRQIRRTNRVPVAVNKTEIGQASSNIKTTTLNPEKQCPIHHKPHALARCRGFRMKTLDERKSLLKEHFICYKCVSSTSHRAKDCKAVIQCSECNSDSHVSAMHAGPPPWTFRDSDPPPQSHGGEADPQNPVTTASCTEICGPGLQGKSCSKICLVNVYPRTSPEKKRRMYVMLDDQSNSSLARSAFFDMFNVQGGILPYTMRTCAGISDTRGRRANDFVIENVNGKVSMLLPTLMECDQIPDNRNEIPTPEAAAAHPHLHQIASQIPPLDPKADILLLLGRDIIQAHKVRSQVNGPNNAPYAQHLDLGWVVVGDICLSGAHRPSVNSFTTNILSNGRSSFFTPCMSTIHIKEKYAETCPILHTPQNELGAQLFQQTTDDDKVALSEEDALFLDIMQKELIKDEANNWVAPLPFRSPRQRLPNNREQAFTRLMSLRKTLKRKPEMREYYVDDGLKSFPSADEAVDVLCRAQKMLAQCNIRLHKISSNCPEITSAFPAEDLAAATQGLELGQTSPPMQRSLGLGWDLATDLFKFQVTVNDKPFTKRGVLSVINSVYDPLGFAVPVIVEGRTILRDISTNINEWDTELPKDKLEQWRQWKDSLKHLQQLEIPRMYTSIPMSAAERKEIIVFCDASIKAVGAVAYLKLSNTEGHSEVGFLLGKARLAPKPDITIPRLELCAAVLAVEVAELVLEELDIIVDQVSFFTDSKVVLGYISNKKRRFYVYVHNRVERIRRFTQPHQWKYVPTHLNPADHATRALPAEQLFNSAWLSGPAFLIDSKQSQIEAQAFELIHPETDSELRPEVTTCATILSKGKLGSARFERFSSWNVLLGAIAKLKHTAQSFKNSTESTCYGWHKCSEHLSENQLNQAKITVICSVQRELYREEIKQIEQGAPLKNSSPLSKLNPFIDTNGILRVGGRLKRAQLLSDETNPILIPSKHHLAQLIIRHFHEKVHHQGRHFTEGAIRAGGFWIVGGKRTISSVIFKCVTCRRLRGKQQEQIMADLPEDRLSTDPPFTHVGLDVFGPWPVSVRKTRGGQADAKRWAVIFTCMSTRAIHIEVIESMDTSSFINALRRFFAIRGAAKLLRSDCGTNFVSACKELQINKQGCHDNKIDNFLKDTGCKWHFNPPHASHMAGSWERMIGVTRKILDAMLLKDKNGKLTHETLVTLMAEVTAIVNARPLTTVSTDPENPAILTPAMLLTQKVSTPPVPPGQFESRDLFRAQWRRVQHLANTFWSRWQKEYITGLQHRRKWKAVTPNLQTGDVVLLKESLEHRNNWPLGLISKTFPSADGRVRKVEVKIFRKGEHRCYLRPISEVVLLVPKDNA
ncbi:uncharacterized protein LOC114478897 isoform X1 [Gouania willdenowi]|uniref:uncharacterized protein LOC114478897 isoform X1 n=1 Tax=Gouania willdenowi TaxID=441366 RepID=UPI00105540D3|nr:uncharacterized protein LOC114478897 isoform X1 [Gouania willdenowi]